MRGLPSILSPFRNEFNKLNNTSARMLDSIYHMTLRLLWNLISAVFLVAKIYTIGCRGGGAILTQPAKHHLNVGCSFHLLQTTWMLRCINYKHNSSPIVQVSFAYGFKRIGCRSGGSWSGQFIRHPTCIKPIKFWMLIPLISKYLNV